MDPSVIGMSAVVLYLGGFCYLVVSLLRERLVDQFRLQILAGAAISLHGCFIIPLIFQANGLDLSLFLSIGLIAFVINLIVFFSSLKKPLHSMYLALFPISMASLSAALMVPSTKSLLSISPYVGLQSFGYRCSTCVTHWISKLEAKTKTAKLANENLSTATNYGDIPL
jgi:ABC-type uncharacterized transport system permease subunit